MGHKKSVLFSNLFFLCFYLISHYWHGSINELSTFFSRLRKCVKLKPIAIINTIFFSSYLLCISVYVYIYSLEFSNIIYSNPPASRQNNTNHNTTKITELHDINMVSITYNTIILSSTNYSSHRTGIAASAFAFLGFAFFWKDWYVNKNNQTIFSLFPSSLSLYSIVLMLSYVFTNNYLLSVYVLDYHTHTGLNTCIKEHTLVFFVQSKASCFLCSGFTYTAKSLFMTSNCYD